MPERAVRGGSVWRNRKDGTLVRVHSCRTFNPMAGVRPHSDMRWTVALYTTLDGKRGGVEHAVDFRDRFDWVRGR